MTAAHVATRTCLGCRQRRPKSAMVRLVRGADGRVSAGPTAAGRGAYVCARRECVERGLKTGRLAHAFRRPSEVDPSVFETVRSGR